MNFIRLIRIIGLVCLVSFGFPIMNHSVLAQDAGHIAKLRFLSDFQKPSGDGPFPAVALLSGCSGFGDGAYYNKVRDRLLANGFAVLRADYLGARGLERCDGGAVTPVMAAGDVDQIIEFARSVPFVDPQRIHVLGWSFGGAVVLSHLIAEGHQKVKSAVAYYPACGSVSDGAMTTPLMVHFGTDDNVTELTNCSTHFSQASQMTLYTYDGAHHGFDAENLPTRPFQYRFGTLAHHPDHAKTAWERTLAFLRE